MPGRAAWPARRLEHFQRGGTLARRPNYGFQKRQKEISRQARKDEKAERKRAKKEAEARGQEPETPSAPGDTGSPTEGPSQA